METALKAQSRHILHDVKAPDLTPQQAVAVAQFRRVAKDLKNTWFDMVRVLDTGDDNAFLDMVGPEHGFYSDFDILVRPAVDDHERKRSATNRAIALIVYSVSA